MVEVNIYMVVPHILYIIVEVAIVMVVVVVSHVTAPAKWATVKAATSTGDALLVEEVTIYGCTEHSRHSSSSRSSSSSSRNSLLLDCAGVVCNSEGSDVDR